MLGSFNYRVEPRSKDEPPRLVVSIWYGDLCFDKSEIKDSLALTRPLKSPKVILADDMVFTGKTIVACRSLLNENGAKEYTLSVYTAIGGREAMIEISVNKQQARRFLLYGRVKICLVKGHREGFEPGTSLSGIRRS